MDKIGKEDNERVIRFVKEETEIGEEIFYKWGFIRSNIINNKNVQEFSYKESSDIRKLKELQNNLANQKHKLRNKLIEKKIIEKAIKKTENEMIEL